jgi:hypothetical protein
MTTEELLKRVDELIAMGNAVLQTRRSVIQGSIELVDNGKLMGFRSASLSFLAQVFGPDHVHTKEFSAHVKEKYRTQAEAGINILQAARYEIANGWLYQIKGLVSAEIFADFLEMAEYLLEEGYKDAAAVMIGSVLEEHLRKLCDKNAIPVTTIKDGKTVPLKADTLNSELTKATIYNKLDMKQVTSWLDLRNKAAHGKYSEYAKEQVTLMLQGVMDFVRRCGV